MKRLWVGITQFVVGLSATVCVSWLLDSMDTSDWAPGVKSIAGILPAVLIITVVLSTMGMITGGTMIYRHLKWKAFGNRIKVAYSAKFCGENTAFTEEVDQLILAMESLGNGATKKTQLGRLKRLAKFVEVPFAVPEEDRLSEEEKTLLFDKEFGADYGRKKKIQA